MNITIIAAGSLGDVQPYIALGVGLKKKGHSVQFLTIDTFKSLAIENGLNFSRMTNIDPKEILSSLEKVNGIKKKNALSSLFSIIKLLKVKTQELLNDSWVASQNSELIISSILFSAANDIAENLGIPCVFTQIFPVVYSTTSFQSAFFPHFFNFGIYNKISYKIIEQMFWQPFKSVINQWRDKTLGLKPHKFFGPYKKIYNSKTPFLSCFSPSVIPMPLDWKGKNASICGYWFLDQHEEYQAPDDLIKFLNSGQKPIYIGFGSMVDKNPEKTTQLILEAVKLSGQRCIISSGWSGLGNLKLPNTVYKIDHIPHSWLFKNVAATIHHGGAGTTASALRAGVPSIITPFMSDQSFWGHHIYKLGLGTKPVKFNKLTAEKLANLITACLENANIVNNAKLFGKKINSENGVEKAIHIIENYMNSQNLVSESYLV